jgi:hypothetical protein
MWVAALALLLVAGCGGSTEPDASGHPPAATASSPSPSSTPDTSPTGINRPCPLGATSLSIRGPGGVRVSGYQIGSGSTVVILEHGAGLGGQCNGWSFGTWLVATQHVRVLMVARCAYNQTVCPPRTVGDGAHQMAAVTQPVVDYARRHGARRITLVGASSGAADVIQAGGVLHGVDALVALSPDVTDTGGPIRAAADRLPTLIAFGDKDRYCVPYLLRRWYHQVTGHPKRLVTFKGQQIHGWDTVLDVDGNATDFAGVVAAWTKGQYA